MKQEDTKRVILDKALELFSAYGYDAVSVAEIAEAVGIKAPSLYNHYPSKQAIFDAIVEETSLQYKNDTDKLSIHVQNSDLDTGLFSGISADFLIEKVHQIFEYSLHNKTISRFRRLLTIEQFRSPQLARLYTERYIERLTAYHAGIFRELSAIGDIKCEDPETLAMMYVAPIITLIGVCDREPDLEAECLELIDNHVRLFYNTYNSKVKDK